MTRHPEPELFPIPESPSPRLQWIKRHGIVIHHAPRMECPWCATIPEDEPLGFERASGSTEDEALTKLAKQAGILMWHEE